MLDKNDEKKMVSIVGEALEQIVLPQFEKMGNRFDTVENRLGTVENRFGTIEKKMDEEFKDVHNSLNRIETTLNASIKRQDNFSDDLEVLNKRVLKLEPKKI